MPANIKTSQETAFREALDQLNPAQRTAVEQVEGPVMVLAGPGTGKTHLLAARIGNILLKTDAGAQNILCLTFTEAGAKAMRERLLSFIGPEAHRVNVFTFHGFCSRVIQDNLQYFGRPGLEPLADLERIRVIRHLLDELPPDSPLRRGSNDPYRFEKHLQHLFAAMKSENWDEDGLLQETERYVKALVTTEGFFYKRTKAGAYEKGDPKTALIGEEKLRMDRLKAGVLLFTRYQEELRQLGRYDYGDMIGWVLRAFHDHPSLLRSYQERFRYLLVDEFQDTNGSQGEIIRLLADYWERPNIFIVGDDDQAIYEFQGARLRSMRDFFRRYEDVTLVTLTDNYRSHQPILDVASRLIDHNERRISEQLPELGVEKTLTSAGEGAEAVERPVRLLNFPDQRQERGALVQQLRAWAAAGVPWSDIAIIYAKNAQAEPLRYLLERAGIPYRSKRRPNVLDAMPVRKLRELLRYVSLESTRPGSGEHLLFRLLHLEKFGAEAADLSRLIWARSREQGVPRSLREHLLDPSRWPETLHAADRISAAAGFLETLIGRAYQLPLAEFVEVAANESGLLGGTLRHPDRLMQLQYLATFSDFVLDEIARRPRLELTDLLTTLDQMDANRVPISLRSHLDQADAVLLVTAHSAKGLEFDRVWLLDVAEDSWGAGGRNTGRFKLPATLTFSGTEDEEEARRRLFFVALTRARRQVIAAFADTNARGRPQQRARFLDELTAGTNLTVEPATIPEDDLASLAHLQLEPTPADHFPALEASAIDTLLADFRLSVSSLYAYLKCPTRFYFEKLLRVPDRERDRALYGTALHQALQDYFNRMLRSPGRQFPSREELQYYFELALSKNRGRLLPAAYDRLLQTGKRELATYYDRYRSGWPFEVEVERYLGHTEVDGVPLVGMIDRVDYRGDAFVNVIDYKTSPASSSKLQFPTKSRPYGGDYWRQLAFYKLLYDNAPGQLRRVREGHISHLLSDGHGQQPIRTLELGRRDTDKLREIIAEVWSRIQARDFTGCGKDDCEWCAFVSDRTSKLPATDLGELALDDAT